MRKLVAVGLVLAVQVACGRPYDDEDQFERAYAERWCDRQAECALGDFERHYSSMEDCVDDKDDDVDLPQWDAGCDIDPEEADACLDWMGDTECAGWEKDEIEEACRNAYDC